MFKMLKMTIWTKEDASVLIYVFLVLFIYFYLIHSPFLLICSILSNSALDRTIFDRAYI